MRILVLKYPEFANGPAIGHAIARRYDLREFYPSRYLQDLLSKGEALGEELKPYLDGNKPVPDSLVQEAAIHFLEAYPNVPGYIFSFFPYHGAQADWLDQLLAEKEWKVDYCLGFDPGQPAILETMDMYVEAQGKTSREEELARYSKSVEYFLEVTSHYKAKGIYRNIRGWEDVETLLGPPVTG